MTCPSNTSVFQDTCTYYCNRGYQLEGNRQTRCTADGTWSSDSDFIIYVDDTYFADQDTSYISVDGTNKQITFDFSQDLSGSYFAPFLKLQLGQRACPFTMVVFPSFEKGLT